MGFGGHDHLGVGEIRHPAEREARVGECLEVGHLDEVAIAAEVDGGAVVDAHLMGGRHHQIAATVRRAAHGVLGILESEAQAVGLGGLETWHAQGRGIVVRG